MVVPIPATPANPPMMVIKRIGHADMNAHVAHMRTGTDAAGPRAGSRADAPDLNAGAHLGVCSTGKHNHGGKYRSGQCFHFRIL